MFTLQRKVWSTKKKQYAGIVILNNLGLFVHTTVQGYFDMRLADPACVIAKC